MTSRLFNFLRILGLASLLIGFSSGADQYQTTDWLPWPWGSECPFPWSKIDGDWVTRDSLTPERFTFTYKGELKNGSRILDVRRYDFNDELVAVGEGISPRGERIVRAAMIGAGSEKGKSYWALVRTYRELQKKSCSHTKQVTVITLRSASATGESDTHFIVDKEDTVRRKKH